MTCIFCKIINNEIPATIQYQDEQVIAIADLNPKAPTHHLIIPKKHIATLNDLTEADTVLAGHLLQVAKILAQQLGIADSGYRTVMNCNDHGGQTVMHIHLHLLGGRSLSWPPG